MNIKKWEPNPTQGNEYRLIIPSNSIKYRKTRGFLNGRIVKVIKYLRHHLGHKVFEVKLLDIDGYPEKASLKFSMWAPYLGCNCNTKIIRHEGCRCGGY